MSEKIRNIGADNYGWNYAYDIKTPKAVVDNLELVRQKINEIIDSINNANNKNELQERINEAIEYLETIKTLAKVDKVNILSISTLEKILKGE